MKRLTVILAPDVQAEIHRQVLYIAADSVHNAFAWEDRLRKAIYDLQDFHGHAIDEDATNQLGHPVRRLVFEGTYLIHYHVREANGELDVIRFRHGARRPKSELI